VIGASIQVASFLLSILGVTLQRRAMIVDEAPSDDAFLVVPVEEGFGDDDDDDGLGDARISEGSDETNASSTPDDEEGTLLRGHDNQIGDNWNHLVRVRNADPQRYSLIAASGTPATTTTTVSTTTESINVDDASVSAGNGVLSKAITSDHHHAPRCRHDPVPHSRCGRFCHRRCHFCYSRVGPRCSHVSRMWLLGFCIFYFSQIVEVFALNFASQSTIVAVGSLSTFVNAIVAVRVFHESFQFLPPKTERTWRRKLFKWDLFNLMFIVAGSVCTVLFAPRVGEEEEHSYNAEKLLHRWIEMPFLVYFIGSTLLVSVLLFRFFRIKRTPLALAISLGTLNSFSITLTKIVTQLVNRNDLFNLKALVMILVWICLLLLQVVLLQIGLRNFEQSGAFSVSGVFGGAMTLTSGMLYYRTFEDFPDDDHIIGFACGVTLMLWGILVFSQRKNLSREEMKRRLFADTIALEEEEEQAAVRARLLSAANADSGVFPVPVYQAIVPSPPNGQRTSSDETAAEYHELL